MLKLKALLRNFVDVRPGEYMRTIFMSLYLLLVLFAYYILKPVSRALFLNKFDIDKLPYLYILIAAFGGVLAYLYTKVAIRSSLKTAVGIAMAFTIGVLVLIYWLIGLNQSWVFYFFNIWVSLFSVMLVSQGWLVAANVFTPREGKRLYGLLGAGAVVGAAFGGTFTAQTVKFIAPRDLLLASAGFVVLAYIAFRVAVAQEGVNLAEARGAESEEDNFQFKDIFVAIRQHKHLQVIVAIILLTFIVDVTIEYQFNAMAKLAFQGHDKSGAGLTAFLGNFYGVYLNLITIVLQLLLTAFVVRRLGVGGTLQIMPVAISVTSIFTFLSPGVFSTGALRLTEAATRYTLNRTGMELLYLPLPLELKNRTKAFVDIFVDRLGRGLGGMLLILFTVMLGFKPKQISLVTIAFAIPWIFLSMRASREYIATVRNRLASRRLDLESARLNVGDRGLLALVEQTAMSDNPRQSSYALSLLAHAPDYPLEPLLEKLADTQAPELKAAIYNLARERNHPALFQRAMHDIVAHARDRALLKAAVGYVLGVSPQAEKTRLARVFVNYPEPVIAEGAIEAVKTQPEALRDVLTDEWIARAAEDENPERRALAASAAQIGGPQAVEVLRRLLMDTDSGVAVAACRAAGVLQDRACLTSMFPLLKNSHIRRDVIASIAAYGEKICGTLADLLDDQSLPLNVRRQVPRILRLIRTQRSVNVLLHAIGHGDLPIRAAVLKALNGLRESAPNLDYSDEFVSQQILKEARYYFELNAALAPFRNQKQAGTDSAGRELSTAASLLARTLEERLEQTIERVFRLLGLRYPPQEIHSAYIAVHRRRGDEFAAALEFLDNVLEREFKRILMPLLDRPEHTLETGKTLFGVDGKDEETAVRDLIRSNDPWLVTCAMATAAELKLRALAPDIAKAAERAGPELGRVAESAAAVLA